MTGSFSAIRPAGFDPAPLDPEPDFDREDRLADYAPAVPVNKQRRPDGTPDAA